MADLPGLGPDDPQNDLSLSARRRIRDAFSEADKIRTRALEAIEARFKSKPGRKGGFSRYISKGQAALEIRKSEMDSAQLILTAILREFRAAGKAGRELREIMHGQIDECVYSLGLTILQRDLLTQELDLSRLPQPEEAIPEYIEERIRVELLRIQAKRVAGQGVIDCLRQGYDLYAGELLGLGTSDPERVLAEDIPVLLFRTAVQHRWIPYPPVRPIRVIANFLEGWYTNARHERIPQGELIDTFGGYRVTPGYGAWFKTLVGDRIAHWRAELASRRLASAASESTSPRDVHPEPPLHPPRPPSSQSKSRSNRRVSTTRSVA